MHVNGIKRYWRTVTEISGASHGISTRSGILHIAENCPYLIRSGTHEPASPLGPGESSSRISQVSLSCASSLPLLQITRETFYCCEPLSEQHPPDDLIHSHGTPISFPPVGSNSSPNVSHRCTEQPIDAGSVDKHGHECSRDFLFPRL